MYHSTPALPLYLQIAESLLDRIEAGELSPGDRLPSERELSQTLGVTRTTLRQALQLLENQKLLVRNQGVGTFIAAPKIERQADRLFSFTKGIKSRGFVPGAKVVRFEKLPANATVAQQLALGLSTSVYYVHRLRLINQEPTMLEKFYIPARRFEGIERHNLEQRSLYEVMETEYGVQVSWARQSFEAVIATEYEVELLGLTERAPLMLERRLTLDKESQPVEFAKDLYRGDRFRFVTEIANLI